MLKRLVVHNLAILENVDVTFRPGFTVLTGATGAGKSLVIDSLSLLLASRASTDLIRAGEEKAYVQGTFSIESNRLFALLNHLEIPCPEPEIVIERTITHSKNTVKINGVAVSLGDLALVAKHLAHIHGQFDFSKILNPDNYLSILDGFAYERASNFKKDYLDALDEYKKSVSEVDALLEKKRRIEENRDFYLFQLKELEEAELSVGEEEEIKNEIALLKNYDRIYSLSQDADALMRSDFLDKLYELKRTLEKIKEYQPQYAEAAEKVDDRYYELEDLFNTLRKGLKALDYDPNRLDYLQQRESDLNQLQRKYHKTPEELIAYRDELKGLLGQSENIEDEIRLASEKSATLRHNCFVKAQELSALRRSVAKGIERDVERNLKRLLLESKFAIAFEDVAEESEDTLFGPEGIDRVDFWIETNIGEGMKSLSKVVSGGEASRIMLAFQVLFVQANRIETIIFDEIDTGLSGDAASAVARQIHELSLSAQVIAITHMPQVASRADHQLLVKKETEQGRTSTTVKELTLEEKIHEIAYLISGGKVTQKQLEYAREMVFESLADKPS